MKLTPEEEKELQFLENKISSGEYEQEDFLHQLKRSWPVQGATGISDSLRNQVMSIIATSTGGQFNPARTGEGNAYEIGSYIGDVLPYLTPAGLVGRMGLSTGLGYFTNPEDPIKGAMEGFGLGALGEAAGPALRAGGKVFKQKVIEPLSLDEMTIKVADKIKNSYNLSMEKAWSHVKPFFDKYGKESLTKQGPRGTQVAPKGFKEAENLFDENRNLFSVDAKNMHESFLENPTLLNTQKLIQQLGADARRMSKSIDPGKEVKEEMYEKTKKELINSLSLRMQGLSGENFSQPYKKFGKDWAKDVGPFYSDSAIDRAAAGNPVKLTDLEEAISTGLEPKTRGRYPGIGKEHDLKLINEEIKKSLGVSQSFPEWFLSGPLKTELSRQNLYGSLENLTRKPESLYRAMIQEQGKGEY